nr:hypothetical protein Iba_chr15fCG2970 [Ipomoea batatas]
MGTSGPPPQEFNEHSISRNSNYIASLNVGVPSVHDIQFGSLEMSLSRTLGSRDTLSDDGVNEGDEVFGMRRKNLNKNYYSNNYQNNNKPILSVSDPEGEDCALESEAGEKKGLSLEGEQMLVEVFGEEHIDNPVLSGMESNVEKSKHVFDLNEVQNDVAQDEPVATTIQQNNEKGMATGGISKHRRKKKDHHKNHCSKDELYSSGYCQFGTRSFCCRSGKELPEPILKKSTSPTSPIEEEIVEETLEEDKGQEKEEPSPPLSSKATQA